MNKTGIFYINGERLELPIYEKGDRVKIKDNSTMAIKPIGTVEGTREAGLFVDIIWDKNSYPTKDGCTTTLGSGWMVSSIELITQQEE